MITNGMIDRYPPHLRSSLALSMSQRADYVRGRYTADVRDRAYSGDLPRVLIIGDSFSQDFYNAVLESGAFADYQISADYIAARCQFRIDGHEPDGAIEPGDTGQMCKARYPVYLLDLIRKLGVEDNRHAAWATATAVYAGLAPRCAKWPGGTRARAGPVP